LTGDSRVAEFLFKTKNYVALVTISNFDGIQKPRSAA